MGKSKAKSKGARTVLTDISDSIERRNALLLHREELERALVAYTEHGNVIAGVSYCDGVKMLRLERTSELVSHDEYKDEMGPFDLEPMEDADGRRWIIGAAAEIQSGDAIESKVLEEEFLGARDRLHQDLSELLAKYQDDLSAAVALTIEIPPPPAIRDLGPVPSEAPASWIRIHVPQFNEWKAEYRSSWHGHIATVENAISRKLELLQTPASIDEHDPGVSSEPNTFRRDGDAWEIRYRGEKTRVKHRKWMPALQELLLHPGRPYHLTELIEFVEPTSVEHERSTETDAVPDATALKNYDAALEMLQARRDAAEETRDIEKVEELDDEIAQFKREMSRAIGPGGQLRKKADPHKRLRQRAAKGLKDCRHDLETHLPPLAAHLRASLRIGAEIEYRAAPRVRWTR